MKIIIFTLVLLHATMLVKAQYLMPDTPQALAQKQNANYYWEKHQKQKNLGWLMLGGGATLAFCSVLIGTVNALATEPNEEPQMGTAAEVMFGVGLASMVCSVPVFISASKQKKKATLAMQWQNNRITGPYPALALQWHW